MQPLLKIDVQLDEAWQVKGKTAEVISIPFHGTVHSPLFEGEILPGAADTQMYEKGQVGTLSARYVLEGKDFRGEPCRIFIENTATQDADGVTKPRIITDSEALQWLERAPLEGRISAGESELTIDIFEKQAVFETKEQRVIDGERSIYGTLFLPENKREKLPLVILSHGYNGSEHDLHDMAQVLAAQGIACYCYDFCGGGLRSKSSGKSTQMSIQTEQDDLRTVIRAMQKQDWVDLERIYLLGESQGGFVTGLTAPELNGEIAGLFLIYPAFTIPDDWREKRKTDAEEIPFWGLTLGQKFVKELPDYDVIEHAAKYQQRVMLFHGDCDEVVKLFYSQRLLEAYPDASLMIYPGQGHGFSEACRRATAGMIVDEIRSHGRAVSAERKKEA